MPITAKFEADFTQFKDAVASAEGALTKFSTSAQGLGTALVASLASTEIRRFAGDVTAVAKDFVGAFAEEEAATKSLTTALQANGTYTPALAAQYAALASEFQHTTAFSDDLMLKMTALMVQVGNVAPGQMNAALTAAANLSAGLNIDLTTATMLVAKAFGSGGESLGKLKALLGDTIPKGSDMAAVMEAINAKFGGQATAQVETYSGRMQQLNNQMSDFKEKIGGLIVDALTPLMHAFAALPGPVQTITVGIIAVGVAVAPLALSFAALSAVITPLIPLIGVALTAALGAISLPMVAIVAAVGLVVVAFLKWNAIVDIAKAVYDGVKGWLVDKFAAIVGWVGEKVGAITGFFRDMYSKVVGQSYVPDMVDGIATEMGRLDTVLVDPVLKATGAAADAFDTLKTSVGTTMAGMSATVTKAMGIGGATVMAGDTTNEERMAMPASMGSYAGAPTVNWTGVMKRALGGPVFAGSSYMVGERGPELFTPSGSGGISPNGAGGITVVNTFHLVDTESNLARRVSDQILQTVKQSRQLS